MKAKRKFVEFIFLIILKILSDISVKDRKASSNKKHSITFKPETLKSMRSILNENIFLSIPCFYRIQFLEHWKLIFLILLNETQKGSLH